MWYLRTEFRLLCLHLLSTVTYVSLEREGQMIEVLGKETKVTEYLTSVKSPRKWTTLNDSGKMGFLDSRLRIESPWTSMHRAVNRFEADYFNSTDLEPLNWDTVRSSYYTSLPKATQSLRKYVDNCVLFEVFKLFGVKANTLALRHSSQYHLPWINRKPNPELGDMHCRYFENSSQCLLVRVVLSFQTSRWTSWDARWTVL